MHEGRATAKRSLSPRMSDVAPVLKTVDGEARKPASELLPLVYEELRRIAKRQWRRQRAGQTLDATALIHEAYLRLADQSEVRWQNRAHFFGVAAKAMRHIVVDHVRTRRAAKRGGAARRVPLDAVSIAVERPVDVVALDDALQDLAALDQRKSQVVELKYFGGLAVREIAEVLQVSEETVARDWRLARTWLLRELSKSTQTD